MGYLTTVTLKTDQDNELIDAAIIGALHKMVDFDVIGNNCKWYSREDDVKKISKLFPNVLITLYINGEENGDLSYEYYKDGKMQVCKANITFPPFDEKLLK